MSVRVRVKSGCNGMGTCERIAPQVFKLDQATGKAVVLLDDASAYRSQVERVRDQCPFVAVEIDGQADVGEVFDEVPVAAARMLTSDVVELRLHRPNYAFEPGQYAFLRLRDADGDFFRAYSVVDAADGMVTFCVKMITSGRGGRALRVLRIGDRVGLGRAMGIFSLATRTGRKVFVAGGTGIAPVLPMCRSAPDADKTVIVGVRNFADLFWLDELEAVPNTTVIPVLEAPDADWPGLRGRVTDGLAAFDITGLGEAYLCGSPGMVNAVRNHLLARGVPESAIRADAFTSNTNVSAPMLAQRATPPEPFDWQGLVRRLHFYASLALAAIILFYAASGFVANRVNLFVAEGASGAPAPRMVPEQVPLTSAGLTAYLAGLWPAGAVPGAVHEGDDQMTAKAALKSADGQTEREWVATVERGSRQLNIIAWRRLPGGLGTDADSLTRFLSGQVQGEMDVKGREDDDASFKIDGKSVWGIHSLEVDKAQRRWQVSTTAAHPAIAFIDLHRGKQAGSMQKLLVDITALLLGFVTLSGVAMGLGAAAHRRRWAAAVLSGGSVLLVIILLYAR